MQLPCSYGHLTGQKGPGCGHLTFMEEGDDRETKVSDIALALACCQTGDSLQVI